MHETTADLLGRRLSVALGLVDEARLAAALSKYPDESVLEALRQSEALDNDGYRILESALLEALEGAQNDTFAGAQAAPSRGLVDDTDLSLSAEGRYDRHHGEEIGRGALGRIERTWDRHLGRMVALKELLSTMGRDPSDALKLRFLREARITAALDHPNIVPVYELGRGDDGNPYYTMRHVRGRTLTEVMQKAPDDGARWALLGHFVQVCQAVAFAHSRGIIHRDLKPDNVMVGAFGETVVLDWGVAKAFREVSISGDLPSPAAREFELSDGTMAGAWVGTPRYMSPEQARAQDTALGPASDIWSLGIMLYELIAGQSPYPDGSALETIRQAADGRVAPLAKRAPGAPPELVAIVRRCLQIDPDDRYPSAKALADDLEAYRTGDRVTAYRYSLWRTARRLVRRHRVASLVALASALIIAVITSTAFLRIRGERDRARVAEQESRSHLGRLLLGDAQRLARKKRWAEVEAKLLAALQSEDAPDIRGAWSQYAGGFRPFLRTDHAIDGGCAFVRPRATTGDYLCGRGDNATWINARTGRTQHTWPTAKIPWATAIFALAPTHTRWAAWWPGGGLSIFSEATGPPTPIPLALEAGDAVTAMTWRADGETLAIGTRTGRVGRFKRATAELHWQPTASIAPTTALVFGPRGHALAAGDAGGWIHLYEGASFRWSQPGHSGPIDALLFSPKGSVLISAGRDGMLRFFGRRAGQKRAERKERVAAMGFSPDGRKLHTIGPSGVLRRDDIARTQTVGRFDVGTPLPPRWAGLGYGSDLWVLHDDKDGRPARLRSYGLLDSTGLTRRVPLGGPGLSLGFSPHTGLLAVGTASAFLTRNPARPEAATLAAVDAAATTIAWDEHRSRWLVGLSDGRLLWPATPPHRAAITRAVAASAIRFAGVTDRGAVYYRDQGGESGQLTPDLSASPRPTTPGGIAPQKIMTLLGDAPLIQDAEGWTWRGQRIPLPAKGRVVGPPGPVVLMQSADQTMWSVATHANGAPMVTALGRWSGVRCGALHRNGRYLALGYASGRIEVRRRSDRPGAPAPAVWSTTVLKGPIRDLAFAPTGDVLAVLPATEDLAQFDLRDLDVPAPLLARRHQIRYGASAKAVRP